MQTAPYETSSSSEASIGFEASRAELERVLADCEFQCTERNKSFLKFVAQALFKGQGESIKAYTIAVDVFGRPASFDPATDPIVRIEATRLRACLSRYYDLHAKEGSVRIDLPKGKYVPVFTRVSSASESPALPPAAPDAHDLQPADRSAERFSRLYPTPRARWTALAAGIVGGLLFGAVLLFAVLAPGGTPIISDKPSVQLEIKLAGDSSDQDAERLRDGLMVALSRFQTLRVMAGTNTGHAAASVNSSSYRITLKYDGDHAGRSVWWQIVDLTSGEALRTDVEKDIVEPQTSDEAIDRLADRLAVRFAGVKGVINSLETAREVEHPTLGNDCILKSSLALETADTAALTQARSCLERTLALRPSDADSNATLSAVLLAIDRPDMPTVLTQHALTLAEKSTSLAPDSSRGASARMIAEFRNGDIEAAMLAGRRAVELNPLNSVATAQLGNILFFAGRWEEGIALAIRASEIEESTFPEAETTLAFDAYRRGEYEETLARLGRRGPTHCYCVQMLKVAVFGQLGRADEAAKAMQELLHSRPGFEQYFRPTMRRWQIAPPLVASLQAGLEKAGLRIQ